MIKVITMWYNESFLAPFFLKHYSFADKITIFLDQDTNDNTADIIRAHMKKQTIEIVPFRFPDGLDELIKIAYLNEAYRTSTADYVIIADADEFVFIDRKLKRNVYYCNLYQVTAMMNLDQNKPIQQANYGYFDRQFSKPSVIKTGLKFEWTPGHHNGYLNGTLLKRYFHPVLNGAHWNFISLDFAVNRLLNNRMPRQSQENLDNKFDNQYNNLTRKSIIEEYYSRKSKCNKLW